MGMFDYIRCERELPDSPPTLEWQTKDTPSQYLDVYEIRADGSLWQEEYDIEDRSDPNADGILALCGCMTRVNKRWEPCKFTGEIRFYGYEGSNTARWWEFSAYFIDGQMQSVVTIERPKRTASEDNAQ